MAELLSEQLSSPFPDDEPTIHSRPKCQTICNIIKWVQCYGIYVAIISQKDPNRVTDLLSYQSLIIQAAQQYQGDCWLRYDHRFRQMVEAKPSTSWAVINITIWNLVFSGRANLSRCSHFHICPVNTNSQMPHSHTQHLGGHYSQGPPSHQRPY